MQYRSAAIVLEDGTSFACRAVGGPGVAAGELCFTTASAGYEEAATDPSYVAQVLCFAYPLVGNYGTDPAHMESDRVQAEAIVMRTARPAWAAWLRERGVVAVEDVDTRALVRRIRANGVIRCAVGEAAHDVLYARALAEPPIDGRPLNRRVGTTEPFFVGAGPRVVLLDLGVKRSIPARLAGMGLEVAVVPGDWEADAIMELAPAAVLIGNGPGDPGALTAQIETVRDLLGRLPLYGICLGHQLVGLALGLQTFKLPFGHRGANHPVRDLRTGRILVTVQNHGFAVHPADGAHVSHISLNDGTAEGFSLADVDTVQFHPEAAPGPLDGLPFFELIAQRCLAAKTFIAS